MMPEARVASPVSAPEAERLAQRHYGLTASARPLPGEYDDNFHLIAGDSRQFVLKVMHPARKESFVDMQCRALTHLAQVAPDLTLPRVILTSSSTLFDTATLEDGSSRLVWLLSYISGKALAATKPHSPELLRSLGVFLAKLDAALLDFFPPAADRELKWDISRSLWARDYLSFVKDARKRELAARFLDLFEREALPRFSEMRRSVIYGDANDHNVLVSPPWPQPQEVLSVIDFGDMHRGLLAGELAIACAYAALGKDNPLAAILPIVTAYHQILPLNEHEIAALFPLLCARLAVSVVNSAHRHTLIPDDSYVTITEASAWTTLEKLARIHPRLAQYSVRAACGLCASPPFEQIKAWLHANRNSAAPLIPASLRDGNCIVLDLSVGSTLLGADPANATEARVTPKIRELISQHKVAVAIGRYNEPRSIYSSSLFQPSPNPTDERRTIHLGMDLFVEPGTPVFAPFNATVHALADNAAPLDYGPVVILRHQPQNSPEFFTLYGHLSRESLASLQPGQPIQQSQPFARVGAASENGGWTPHLHFQIILDLLDLGTDFQGVASASQRDLFTSLSPDPNLVLNIPDRVFPPRLPDIAQTLSSRKKLLGGNLSVSYRQPLKIVKGWRQYLYNDTGRAFLDVYNNVPLVGHSHPRVAAAIQEQVALLNTNTRYLHDNIHRYAERLTALLPPPLRVCYFLNSGSEANELALRLARAYTRREDVIVLEHAYHGHTSTLIDISPYKFNGPGGSGRKPWVHVAPIADDYRGLYRRGEPAVGKKYAHEVAAILELVRTEGRSVAAFIAETLPSVAGQIVFPPDYLREVYSHVRAAGTVCIADEVQIGFGRLGSHFWGFETQGVVPDIVVLGKPIANAFPFAAVVTTSEIASAFANGMEFFSTFGGNPVSCAAALAVLDVLLDENLPQNARVVGSAWLAGLVDLQSRHQLIGDVRGAGLFLGLDLVANRETREPATQQADYVVNRLRENGILAGTDGPHHNVIKLRPPLIFSPEDAGLFTSTLAEILQEDPAQPG
ncbi:MAG TPA: aminotransferase class III-fold pyridoxal phosphate-dependent enzyme [Dongiaceae bacterium]|nr:aminotransferase class III-fold pyridoxal phosphate-dependent enzyme [Dongiaceae bacterium]